MVHRRLRCTIHELVLLNCFSSNHSTKKSSEDEMSVVCLFFDIMFGGQFELNSNHCDLS